MLGHLKMLCIMLDGGAIKKLGILKIQTASSNSRIAPMNQTRGSMFSLNILKRFLLLEL
jgi:hypothetical protein